MAWGLLLSLTQLACGKSLTRQSKGPTQSQLEQSSHRPAKRAFRTQLRPGLEPTQYVLIRSDARLHASIDRDGALGHDTFFHQRLPSPGQPASARPYRLIAHHGEWLELESITPAAKDADASAPGGLNFAHGLCTPPELALRGLALRLFVHRSELFLTNKVPVTRLYPDGSRVSIEPGVPLSAPLPLSAPPGVSVRHLELGGISLNLDLPKAALAQTFRPEPAPPSAITGARLWLKENQRLRFGLGATLRLNSARPLLAERVGSKKGPHKVRLRAPCMVVEALLERLPLATNALPPILDPGSGGQAGQDPASAAASPTPAPGDALLAAGQELYWPEGGLAGGVEEDLWLPKEAWVQAPAPGAAQEATQPGQVQPAAQAQQDRSPAGWTSGGKGRCFQLPLQIYPGGAQSGSEPEAKALKLCIH